MSEKNKSTVRESDAVYEKAETDLLREALNRTHKERFLMLTQLYKIQQTLQKAKITHRNSADSK
jgi:hypothetical protein